MFVSLYFGPMLLSLGRGGLCVCVCVYSVVQCLSKCFVGACVRVCVCVRACVCTLLCSLCEPWCNNGYINVTISHKESYSTELN